MTIKQKIWDMLRVDTVKHFDDITGAITNCTVNYIYRALAQMIISGLIVEIDNCRYARMSKAQRPLDGRGKSLNSQATIEANRRMRGQQIEAPMPLTIAHAPVIRLDARL